METLKQTTSDNLAGSVQKVYFRCPRCRALYQTSSAEITVKEPQFQCAKCQCQFSFPYPSPMSMLEGGVILPLESAVREKKILKDELRNCPKCGSLNVQSAQECSRCHVIFARIKNLPLDPKIHAFPSLVRMWQELLSDYENIKKHMDFVDRCEDLQAIPFALRKYRDLKEAQPQDSLAQEMYQTVWSRSLQRTTQSMGEWFSEQTLLQKIPWQALRQAAPYAIPSLIMIVGIFIPALRNLIGFGAALLFGVLGFQWFLRKKN